MSLRDVLRIQLKRVNPFRGLVIDSTTWADAHEYHRTHLRLHNLAMHQPGIVFGLGIQASDPADRSVVIEPGLAVDPDGNVVIVADAQRYHFQTEEAGTVYLLLQYREIPTDIANGRPGEGQAARILEAYRIQERLQLPEEPFVELARVTIADARTPITNAGSPFDPKVGELDLRFRVHGQSSVQEEVTVGEVCLDDRLSGWNAHEAGLRNLVEEITSTTRYRGAVRGPLPLTDAALQCHLLYITGSEAVQLTAQEEQVLAAQLKRGGVILFEEQRRPGRQAGPGDLGKAVLALSQKLNLQLRLVARGHPVLSARHVFTAAPPGSEPNGQILEAGGLFYSTAGYGAAWQGGLDDSPLPRQAIREALEFGVNLVTLPSRR